jgi:hypothetical protein
MYLAKVVFKREANSLTEKGYYIGEHESSKDKGTYLDTNFQALPRDEKGFQVWDSNIDLNDMLELRL